MNKITNLEIILISLIGSFVITILHYYIFKTVHNRYYTQTKNVILYFTSSFILLILMFCCYKLINPCLISLIILLREYITDEGDSIESNK